VRPASANDAKKDTAKATGRVRVIEDKDPNAPEQSFIAEQKTKNLSDFDVNVKCPVDLKVYGIRLDLEKCLFLIF
jgi:hypothetical protein